MAANLTPTTLTELGNTLIEQSTGFWRSKAIAEQITRSGALIISNDEVDTPEALLVWLADPENVPDFATFGKLAGQPDNEAAENGQEIYMLYADAFKEMSKNVSLGKLMNKIRPRL